MAINKSMAKEENDQNVNALSLVAIFIAVSSPSCITHTHAHTHKYLFPNGKLCGALYKQVELIFIFLFGSNSGYPNIAWQFWGTVFVWNDKMTPWKGGYINFAIP